MIQVRLALIIGLICFSCNQPESKNTTTVETVVKTDRLPKKDKRLDKDTLTLAGEKAKLGKLIRRVYEWHETKSSMDDFEPITDKKGTSYIAIDKKKLTDRLNELKATNFFDDSFLKNYNNIALTLDEKLKNKQLEWFVGDMPPFGNDANPWCNCQDSPENYWNKLTLTHLTISQDVATFAWTWGDDSAYNVKTIKSNGVWRIAYLQGFDPKDFIPAN
jgi:hypothetical protein